MDRLVDRRDIYYLESRVFAQMFDGKHLVLEPVVAGGGSLQGLLRLLRFIDQLCPPLLQDLSFLFVVPTQDITAGVAAPGPVVLFMAIFILDQPLQRDGAVIPFQSLLALD